MSPVPRRRKCHCCNLFFAPDRHNPAGQFIVCRRIVAGRARPPASGDGSTNLATGITPAGPRTCGAFRSGERRIRVTESYRSRVQNHFKLLKISQLTPERLSCNTSPPASVALQDFVRQRPCFCGPGLDGSTAAPAPPGKSFCAHTGC